MKTNENKIVFIHVSNSDQKIVVEDQASANSLEQALNQYNNRQWIRTSGEVTPPEFSRKFFSLKEFRVILVCGNSSFRSASYRLTNTSLSLKTRVPSSFLGRECVAYICNSNSNDQIGLSCTISLDQNGESIIDFSRTKPTEVKRLEAWI